MFESGTYERCSEVQEEGQVEPSVHWTIRNIRTSYPIDYHLAFPPSLFTVHNVFYVSILRKYISYPSSVVPLEVLGISDSLS